MEVRRKVQRELLFFANFELPELDPQVANVCKYNVSTSHLLIFTTTHPLDTLRTSRGLNSIYSYYNFSEHFLRQQIYDSLLLAGFNFATACTSYTHKVPNRTSQTPAYNRIVIHMRDLIFYALVSHSKVEP